MTIDCSSATATCISTFNNVPYSSVDLNNKLLYSSVKCTSASCEVNFSNATQVYVDCDSSVSCIIKADSVKNFAFSCDSGASCDITITSTLFASSLGFIDCDKAALCKISLTGVNDVRIGCFDSGALGSNSCQIKATNSDNLYIKFIARDAASLDCGSASTGTILVYGYTARTAPDLTLCTIATLDSTTTSVPITTIP